VSGPIATVVAGLLTGNVTALREDQAVAAPVRTFWTGLDDLLNALGARRSASSPSCRSCGVQISRMQHAFGKTLGDPPLGKPQEAPIRKRQI
jgi:hypothetical protein